MSNLKRICVIALGGIVLFATASFGKTGTVNAPSGLVLREKASKSSNPIITVNDNIEVEILEKSGEWYKVKYNNYEGYLFAEYIKVDADETVETNDTKEESAEKQEQEAKNDTKGNNKNIDKKQYPQKQKVESNIKIYTIPSVTSKTMANVKKNSEITINYELNNWVNVTYGKNTGWARKYFLNNKNEETTGASKERDNAETEEKTTNETYTITENKKGYINVSNSANIRKKASTSSEVIDTLLRNTEVTIIGEEGDFYKIKYQDITGYISKSLVSDKPVADVTSRSSAGERKQTSQVNTVTESKKTENTQATTNDKPATSNSSVGNDVVSFAKKYVGYNYTYGGSSPSTGFDCSGFAYYVFNSCGYSIGRTCKTQSVLGTSVSRQNLSAGDLIFFNNGSNGSIGHVGIYIGGGKFVHAENSKTGVRIDTINSGYYNKYYYSARRIAK